MIISTKILDRLENFRLREERSFWTKSHFWIILEYCHLEHNSLKFPPHPKFQGTYLNPGIQSLNFCTKISYKYGVKGISADLVHNWRVQLPKFWVCWVTAELLGKHWIKVRNSISKGPVLGLYANHFPVPQCSPHFALRICWKTKAKHLNCLLYQLNQMSIS